MDDRLWETGDVFANGDVLSEDWTPEEMPEREQQLAKIIKGLRRVFRGESPKNMFLYGKTGQGKTEAVRLACREFERRADDQEISAETIVHPCRNLSSSYHVACDIVETYTGEDPNGYSQQKVFNKMYDVLEGFADNVVLVLDEIDAIGKHHDILYDIPRARDTGAVEDTKIGIIGITNDRSFLQNIDPRAKSSLYDEEIEFESYGSGALRSILERRVSRAFRDEAVSAGAIGLCAAFAAQDEGSARQALEFMYEAGEIVVDSAESVVQESHMREAKDAVYRREAAQSIRGLTLQDQMSLISIIAAEAKGDVPCKTRYAYAEYSNYTNNFADTNTLTFNQMREHLKELEMLDIVSKSVRSGDEQGGRKYLWEITVDLGAAIEVLQSVEDARISECMEYLRQNTKNKQLQEFT